MDLMAMDLNQNSLGFYLLDKVAIVLLLLAVGLMSKYVLEKQRPIWHSRTKWQNSGLTTLVKCGRRATSWRPSPRSLLETKSRGEQTPLMTNNAVPTMHSQLLTKC